ncbi:hypothetical protein BH10ACI1_BH10ACI1_32610 [soil metagenome]
MVKNLTEDAMLKFLVGRVFCSNNAQQIIGREGETATFLSRCVVYFGLRVFGFAPCQFNR